MKLEAGNYVRIQWGNGEQTISKCTNKVDIGNTQYSNNDFYIHTDKKGEVIYKSMIVKASHNIIDLIEVGDYVNGHLVTKISKDGFVWLEGHSVDGTWKYVDFINEWGDNIKSIVTKEQFESMQYKVD